jgi:hypothetical protein
VGWWLQANWLQRQYDYQLAPCVLLALAVLTGYAPLLAARQAREGMSSVFDFVWPALAALLPALALATAIYHPALNPNRLARWPECWRQGSTPALRDALTLDTHFSAPTWVDLARVESYLRSRQVGDRELICFSMSTLPLYGQLNVEPATRFVMLYSIVSLFRSHWPEVAGEVSASPQRFVVSDLMEWPNMTAEQASSERPGFPLALPPGMPPSFQQTAFGHLYPWSEPVVFRAGRYFVHRYRSDQELKGAGGDAMSSQSTHQ